MSTLLQHPATAVVHNGADLLPIGTLVVGDDHAIVAANREIERLSGYGAGELIGRPLDLLIPEPLRAAPPIPHELFARRKDGSEVRVEVSLTPLRVRDTPLVVACVLDLTRRADAAAAHGNGEEPTEFELMVGELGAEFVNLRPEEVDQRIEDALSRVVRTLGLDRSAVFQVNADGDVVHTHQWTRPGWSAQPPRLSARDQFPWLLSQVRSGTLVAFSDLDEVPDDTDRESYRRMGTRSAVTVPLTVGGEAWGAVTFATLREPRRWSPALVNRLRVIAFVFAAALSRKREDERLRADIGELGAHRDRLREENRYLREELKTITGAPAIVGHSRAIRRVVEQVRQVAPGDTTVLLSGETGTGKSLIAACIHELSARRERPLVRVDCASLAGWIEGDPPGPAHGSVVEVPSRHPGRFELADRSTVFLHEVADLPPDAQARLVRILQNEQVQPLGGGRPRRVDVRVIASTRKDLKRAIKDGTFREDLYYRLSVVPIHIPPLRERREDIAPLVWRFVDEFAAALRKPIDAIDQTSMAALEAYAWPGNARELRNVVERAMIVPTGRLLHLTPPASARPARGSARRPRR